MTEASKEAVEALSRAARLSFDDGVFSPYDFANALSEEGFTIAPIAPVTDEKLRELSILAHDILDGEGYDEAALEVKSALSELAQLRAENKLMATRYEVGNELTIERASHRPDTWAIRKYGYCMAKDGKFEYEPMPSNRDAAFLERCRFNSLADAVYSLPTPPKED